MKERGPDKQRSSLALKVEAIALAILWVFALFAAITSLAAATEVDAHPVLQVPLSVSKGPEDR